MPVPDQTSKEIAALHAKVKDLLQQGHSDEQVVQELKKDGIEEHYTLLVIDNVHNDHSDKKSFRNAMIMGTFYIAAGLLLNILLQDGSGPQLRLFLLILGNPGVRYHHHCKRFHFA
jgi:hypothetical protein